MARAREEWIAETDDQRAPPRVAGTLWTIIADGDRSPSNKPRLVCRCECGTTRLVLVSHLKNGRTKSCGCNRHTVEQPVHQHPLYRTYCNIIQRCENPRNAAYKNYGARGISMAPEWRSDFWQFVADVGDKPSKQHSIERKDNSLGYQPGNCAWADRRQQMRNTRRNHIVTYHGRKMPLVEACDLSGTNYGTAKWRLANGVSESEAFK